MALVGIRTQADLARKMGITRAFLSSILIGNQKMPMSRLRQLSELLCVSPGWLLEDNDD
jgi:transcriptional regulator with XRE-family HTH domain